MKFVICLAVLLAVSALPIEIQSSLSSGSKQQGVYDPKIDHIWNRLYRSLFVRTARDGQEYGTDELDPLLWGETKHLLTGPSHQQAIKLLDEFLNTNAAALIADPLKRAMLQRDLWAVFDWSAQTSHNFRQERRELQIRLVQAIHRLALRPEQIQALPDNYANAVGANAFSSQYDPDQREKAFLPHDLFQPEGPWVCLSARGGRVIAPSHAFGFSGRSVFLVFMRLPEGRQATLAYLSKLTEFPKPWIPHPRFPDAVLPNPELPQFPVGTQLAFVRQMALIDHEGNFTPTRITEQVQLRVHRAISTTIPESVNLDSHPERTAQDFFEFKLSRAKLLAGDRSGLHAVTRDEKEFPLFSSHGIDVFEHLQERDPIRHLRTTLNFCVFCHFRPGIHSAMSFSRLSDPYAKLIPTNTKYEGNMVTGWKQSRYDWGLLQGLWQVPLKSPPR